MRWTSLHLVLLVLAQLLSGITQRQTDPVDRLWFAQEPEALRPGDVFVDWEQNQKYERAYASQRRRASIFSNSRRELLRTNQVSLRADRTLQNLLGATLRKHSRRRRLGSSGMNRIHERFRKKMHRARHHSHLSSADIGEKYENYGAKYEDTTRFRPLSSFGKKRKKQEKSVANCDETLKGDRGDVYAGCQEETVGGFQCQKWASQNPHSHPFHPQVFMDKHLDHNYCRNPNGKQTIWCFTTDPEKRWDYCNPVDTSTDTQVGSSKPRHRKRKHRRRRPKKRKRGRRRRRKKVSKGSRRNRKRNLKDMGRADLEMEIRKLRGENRGIKKQLNHCPSLAFPDAVIDCGVYKKLKGNTRRCYGQDEGCVGAGWFSKVRGPPSSELPDTVNAIAICSNQGYSHVDKIQYGGNFNIHCL